MAITEAAKRAQAKYRKSDKYRTSYNERIAKLNANGEAYRRGVEKRKRLALIPEQRLRHVKMYGISIAQYQNMVVAQNGVCAICGKDNGRKLLCVDHDHTTGKVRSLLCTPCNVQLGIYEANVSAFSAYLSKHKGN